MDVMSQTKRRRRTKHRGNAAGVVESRGRTGRRPTTDERKSAKGAARPHRLDQPPTWGSAAKRTAVILAPLVVVLALVSKPPAVQLIILAVFIFILYVPLGYYTDLWMYRRRQRQRAEGRL
jgi:Flp pilus assembly protein TadB